MKTYANCTMHLISTLKDTVLKTVALSFKADSKEPESGTFTDIHCGESTTPDVVISPMSDHGEYWTVTFCDDKDRWWGTEAWIRADLVNKPDQRIELQLEKSGTEYKLEILRPDKSPKLFDVQRR